LVIDDGSNDSGPQIVSEIGRSDHRISLLRVGYNSGRPAVPRNIGIRNSKGSIIAFLDADDWWYSRKLEYAVGAHLDGADVVYHHLRKFDWQHGYTKTGRSIKESSRVLALPLSDINSYDELLFGRNALPNSSVTVWKEKLVEIDLIDESPDLRAIEDYDTWLRLAENGVRFVRLPLSLGIYSVNAGNITESHLLSEKRLSMYRRQRFRQDPRLANGTYWVQTARRRPVIFLRHVLSILRKFGFAALIEVFGDE